MSLRHLTSAAFAVALLASAVPGLSQPLGDYIVLSWNDLGMHCMNQNHATLSILPPYNTLQAQVILRGDADSSPELVLTDVTLEYSIPGNTYSVGKTNFWDYDFILFGVDLPPNIGLTGRGLTGEMDAHAPYFIADGIPNTPYTDAQPLVEDPYQQALIILRDGLGTELARSTPVIPVSAEINCISAGCHSSESQILHMHEDEDGFDPDNPPILCAWCHGSPPLTGPDPGTGGWFSMRIHGQHEFIDETLPGIDGCYKCHPGTNTQCLRDVMSTQYDMICQDCHGNMQHMAQSIDDGRIPWLEEPACRTCHTANYGEPVGQLYRMSTGHGNVMCSACHDSPHAIYPSREPRDNANMIALQGHAGTLSDCRVCHGVVPHGAGPHGIIGTDVVESELLGGASALQIHPAPLRLPATATIRAARGNAGSGRMLVFDAQGRTVRLLNAQAESGGRVRASWDGLDGHGEQVPAGVYFVRWQDESSTAAGKLVVLR